MRGNNFTPHLILLIVLIFSGCAISGSGVKKPLFENKVKVYEKDSIPYSWDEIYNSHNKHIYKYYLSKNIYYNIRYGIYYYYQKDKWNKSQYIPSSLINSIFDYIIIEMDTDRPYLNHEEVLNKISLKKSVKEH